MKIQHNNENYTLDMSAAIKMGILVKDLSDPTTFKAGDVFAIKGNENNPFLLIRAKYLDYGIAQTDTKVKAYQLMGIGCTPNSGEFFKELHSLEEVYNHLSKLKMVRIGNLRSTIYQLVNDLSRE